MSRSALFPATCPIKNLSFPQMSRISSLNTHSKCGFIDDMYKTLLIRKTRLFACPLNDFIIFKDDMQSFVISKFLGAFIAFVPYHSIVFPNLFFFQRFNSFGNAKRVYELFCGLPLASPVSWFCSYVMDIDLTIESKCRADFFQ